MIYSHIFTLILAAFIGAVKGYVDGSIIAGGGRIRHGLHLAIWALALIAVLAGYAWGRPLDWGSLGATALSAWGLSALVFRTVLSAIAQWDWDYLGSTAVYDRVLVRLFGYYAGTVAAGVEFMVLMAGLVWYWA